MDHAGQDMKQMTDQKGGHPYMAFWLNMVPGFLVMYLAMFAMIDGPHDFHNNLNMVYMTITMWAPMGILMLATMCGMFPDKGLNRVLYALFTIAAIGSFAATRQQALIGDKQFIASMIPHHSGAILMCREANLKDAELITLCANISKGQREEIEEMERIGARLKGDTQ